MKDIEKAIAWLSETFNWDAVQTGEFLRGLAADAWEEGARDGSRGLLPLAERVKRNPYLSKPCPRESLHGTGPRDCQACDWTVDA